MKESYKVYTFSLQEWLLYGGGMFLLYGAGCWLLYNSCWPWIGFPVFFYLGVCRIRRNCMQRQKKQLKQMFLPFAECFVVALRAGYSAESALVESRKDICRLAGSEEAMAKELMYMENQLHVGVALEQLFTDLAVRCQDEDIGSFADVFAAGKRTGGQLDQILTVTLQHMKEKMETQKDIEAEIASRQMEQRIMSIVPWGILLYLRATSAEYMAVLYTSTAGRGVMTVCLGLYLVAWFWGKQITDIQV